MTRIAFAIAVALALGAPATASAQHSFDYYLDRPLKPTPPRAPAKAGTGPGRYWGGVTEVGKDWITVQFADEKPVRFSVSETLASGGFAKEGRPLPPPARPHVVSPSDMFRLKDVKVGDRVNISYVVINGTVICDHICIGKRPGGRMPALPKEAEDLRKPEPPPPGFGDPPPHIPYHEYWDAYWDLEDKGIPYPEKFGSRRWFPAAPMPHPVDRNATIAP